MLDDIFTYDAIVAIQYMVTRKTHINYHSVGTTTKSVATTSITTKQAMYR